ncbi:MAG TPA: exopolysaccharide biosynthesis polyprenyl glycosylphosphotransferase [Solirubrobacteraceae bacterium]|jgi:exopolysaccharide biosynthesis polyprenyl glycosylphosphotransferase
MATDVRTTTAGARSSPLVRPAFGRRSWRRVVELPIREGRCDRDVRVREAVFRRSLALADVVAAGVALVLWVAVVGDDGLRPVAVLALPLVVIAGKAHGLYDRDELVVNKTTIDQAPALFQCATLYALLVLLLQGAFVAGSLSAAQAVGVWATLFFAALVARRVARWVAGLSTPVERCLFVGSDESYERLHSKLPDADHRARLVGRMALNHIADEQVLAAGTATLHRLIAHLGVHRVIIEPSEALPQITLDFVREAKSIGVRVSLLPRILEVVGSTIEVDDVNGLTLLGVRRFGLTPTSKLIKRSFDGAGAALGLLALAPLLTLIAILIKLDSRGPVIFRQTRIGRGGRAFQMWKFRTMFRGADTIKGELRARNDCAMGLFKLRDDPRITRIGHVLRRTCLDELPQLVNVLRGEMSLVGPRPLVADEDQQITGRDRSRLQLTPGITGHWQIQGARVPIAEMVKLDYLYVAGWSLWLDIKILLRTVAYVLARRGM